MTTLESAQPPRHRRVVDVSALPNEAFGHQGLIYWGTLGYMIIEGSMFVMTIIVYFYLRLKVQAWPPSLPNPNLEIPTANLLLMLVSCVPNALAKKAADNLDQRRTLRWMLVVTLMGAGNLVLRFFEYGSLNCRWDDNAYASITWLLLSLHTIHIGTDVVETAVLTALFASAPMKKSRFVDASENAFYWYFIAAWWIPVYLVIYWAPRWL